MAFVCLIIGGDRSENKKQANEVSLSWQGVLRNDAFRGRKSPKFFCFLVAFFHLLSQSSETHFFPFYRQCLLGTSCDMFEYGNNQCSFFPHRAFKRENLFNVIEPNTAKNIFVLHCAVGQENIVKDSDLRLRSFQSTIFFYFWNNPVNWWWSHFIGWQIQTTCSEYGLAEMDYPSSSKSGVNGHYQYVTYGKCIIGWSLEKL